MPTIDECCYGKEPATTQLNALRDEIKRLNGEIGKLAQGNLEAQHRAAVENSRLRAEIDSVKAMHNGYDPEARKVMPELKEPSSLVSAVKELIEEAEAFGRMEVLVEMDRCEFPAGKPRKLKK